MRVIPPVQNPADFAIGSCVGAAILVYYEKKRRDEL